MAIQVDFVDKLIYITSPQTEVLIQDLVNAIREAEETQFGICFAKIADASGKETLGSGVTVGITLELSDEWQLQFWAGDYIATITGGNLVGGVGGDPVAYSAGVQVLIIQSAASTIVTTTGGGTSATTDALVQALVALQA